MKLNKTIINTDSYHLLFRLKDNETHLVRYVVTDKTDVYKDNSVEVQKSLVVDLPRMENVGKTLFLKIYTDGSLQYKSSFRVYPKITVSSEPEKLIDDDIEETIQEPIQANEPEADTSPVTDELPKNIIEKDIKVDLTEISLLSESLFITEAKNADWYK